MILIILRHMYLLTNHGKLLKTLTYLALSFLSAYPGWSLKPMAQNYQYLFIFFIALKMSSVYRAYYLDPKICQHILVIFSSIT